MLQVSGITRGRRCFLFLFVIIVVVCFISVPTFYNSEASLGDSLLIAESTSTHVKTLENHTENYIPNTTNSQFLVNTGVKISENRRSKNGEKTKPKNTIYEELVSRRTQGYFDGILLRNLLVYTELLQQPTNVCSNSQGNEMVALVQSACPHQDNRNAIRETWGRLATLLKIPVIFFVGKCPNSREESEQFHDIVEVNFSDTYYNNTIKSLARFKWFTENCNKARSLFMADDDTVVMLDYLLEYMRDGVGFSMIGPFYHGSHIVRNRQSKWFVPELYYPLSTYPDYLGGWGYVVNGPFVELLYNASLEVPFVTIDDALFTGIVAEIIGMHRFPVPGFPVYKDVTIRCDDTSIFLTQFLQPEEIRSYWRERNNKCKH